MEELGKKLIFMLLSLMVVVVFSCTSSSNSEFKTVNRIDFDTISVDERHHLDNDAAGPYCDINVEFIYPAAAEDYNLENLQQFFVRSVFGISFESISPELAVDAYVKNYFENYTRDANTYQLNTTEIDELNALIPDADISNSMNESDNLFYSYYESLSDSIVFNKYDIISFQVKQSNSKRGVTSDYVSYSNYVVNLLTGKQITENEIFMAGFDRALQNLIITSLLDQNDAKSIEELEDIGFYGVREILPNGNFLLTDKGIIYTYNKGEYSAIQLSAPEVFIPYNSVRSILRENTIISRLADL